MEKKAIEAIVGQMFQGASVDEGQEVSRVSFIWWQDDVMVQLYDAKGTFLPSIIFNRNNLCQALERKEE